MLTALHWSAKEGHLSVVETLLKHRAKTEAVTIHGNTALHLAAESNHSEIVDILIKHCAKLNVENEDKNTPIKVAILNGHVKIVDTLMNQPAEIGSTGNRELSLLYQAADAGQLSIVHSVLHRVKDEKKRLCYVNATLRRTAQYGQFNLIPHLLKYGAKVDATDDDGWSPLFLAGQHVEVLCMLIHSGASIGATNTKKKNQSVLHHFASLRQIDALFISLTCGCNIHVTDINYDTALHYAAKTNDLDVVDILLKRGVDINAMNRRGETALHVAIENERFDIAKLLIERGIDIEAKTFSSELTALHIAFENQAEELISLLMEKGANVNAKNARHETALHIAAKNNLNIECGRLIKNGAKVNVIAIAGETPLRHAIDNLNPYLVKLLLTHGSPVQRFCHIGNPLEYAISAINKGKRYAYDSGFIPVIKFLIDYGAERNTIILPESLKWRYPTLETIIKNYFSESNHVPAKGTIENKSSKTLIDDKLYGNTTNNVLQSDSFVLNDKEGDAEVSNNKLLWPKNTVHKYGRSFPYSKYLQLNDFPRMDNQNGHGQPAGETGYTQSWKPITAVVIDTHATAIIQHLLKLFDAKIDKIEDYFVLNMKGCAEQLPPPWASDFDKMNGIIREQGRLIVQIPSKNTNLSVPEWHRHENPHLGFIEAVYVCRRSSTHHNQEAFADILGGSEQTLKTDLHSILIACLSILSIAGGDGLVEKLVMAILNLESGPILKPLPSEINTGWCAQNRRQCSCESKSVHRPLSPVAAAKAVGIDIWRERHEHIVKRVWDIQKDELVDNIDVRKVIFITHRWSSSEVTYQNVMKRQGTNGQAMDVSNTSEKLTRIRETLLKHTQYVWIDTICIDKSNLSELDEAIRSMYKWYANCAAVVLDSHTPLEEWRMRGWCLQEGGAAGILCGMTRGGHIATIQTLAAKQRQDLCTLDLHLHYRPGNAAEILARMDLRKTTRIEDMAYALAGVFSIHLTLAYGEGIKSRERLLHELAIQRGDISFLSFQSTEKQFQNYLPAVGQVNYLMAECIEASTPVMVSHFGICIDVKLEEGPRASLILQKLKGWKDLSFANGRSLGENQLIQRAESPENKKSVFTKLAIVHCIRSIMLLQSYDKELQKSGGGRIIECYHRLQCCQIEEMEFTRLFAEDREGLVRIWLRDMPSGSKVRF
ncbi:ankyrin repeat-containing domain protein [Umbelopsis sp. AD052]|nr:ankyrin repeat-containing domain protein [Umbelopsis sp. AD052]